MLEQIFKDNNAEIERLRAIETEHIDQVRKARNISEARSSLHAARMVAKVRLDIEQENAYVNVRLNMGNDGN